METIRTSGKKIFRSINPLKPWQRSIVISEPEVLKAMFVGPLWEKWQRGHPLAAPHDAYAGGLVFMPNGQKWRDARAMFDRTFTTPAVRSYVPIVNHLRDIFMSQLEELSKNSPDGFIEIQRPINKFTFE